MYRQVISDGMNTGNKRKVIIYLFFFFLGIVIGGAGMALKNKIIIEQMAEGETFSYGLVESNFTVSDILWVEYPKWREISCSLTGNFQIQVPKGTDVTFIDLQNVDALSETSRQSLIFSGEGNVLSYDLVTYEINGGYFNAAGLEKLSQNTIDAATKGYRLKIALENEQTYVLGYIPPMSTKFSAWDSLQNKYADQDLTIYLPAFELSPTYLDKENMDSMRMAEDVSLTKEEGGYLNCTVHNTRTNDWICNGDMPALEMWYRGVWIYLDYGIDNTAMSKICPANQDTSVLVPPESTQFLSSLLPGIYRIVLYGAEGKDYIATDCFEVLEAER